MRVFCVLHSQVYMVCQSSGVSKRLPLCDQKAVDKSVCLTHTHTLTRPAYGLWPSSTGTTRSLSPHTRSLFRSISHSFGLSATTIERLTDRLSEWMRLGPASTAMSVRTAAMWLAVVAAGHQPACTATTSLTALLLQLPNARRLSDTQCTRTAPRRHSTT